MLTWRTSVVWDFVFFFLTPKWGECDIIRLTSLPFTTNLSPVRENWRESICYKGFKKLNRPHLRWCLCGSVVREHRSAESEGLRFDSSWGFKIFFLSYARDKTKKWSSSKKLNDLLRHLLKPVSSKYLIFLYNSFYEGLQFEPNFLSIFPAFISLCLHSFVLFFSCLIIIHETLQSER